MKSNQSHIFYSLDFDHQKGTLKEDEFSHCTKVLRKNIGDIILITKGDGILVECQIEKINKDHLSFVKNGIEIVTQPKSYFLEIAIAPTKNPDRLEFFLEKAIEIGIDSVVIIATQNTERKNINIQRLEKIAISAMKQSRNTFKTQIIGLISFKDYLKSDIKGSKLIAYVPNDYDPSQSISKIITKGESISLLIGPEGDFDQQEIKLALQQNFKAINLGNSILRTETAGIYSAAIIQSINI